MIQTDSFDYHNLTKVIMSKEFAFLSDSDELILINEILKDKYKINLHIAEEKAFLSLVGSLMNKSLNQTIQSKVDQM